MEKIWPKLIFIFCLVTLLVWLIVYKLPDNKLHLIFCNVGQGDAILLTYRTTQILIDGGPNSQVLSCLSKFIPFWDRQIEAVFLTHLESDHATGLVKVLEQYEVGTFITTPLDNSTSLAKVLEQTLIDKQVPTKLIDSNSDFRFGLISLDTIWPTPQFLTQAKLSSNCSAQNVNSSTVSYSPSAIGPKVLGCFTSSRLNDYSLVFHLKFNDFDALLPGDADSGIQDKLLSSVQITPVEVLKFPHHGSKTGITDEFLKALSPQLAVISVGKNSYGHPSPQVLDQLTQKGINFLRTDQAGDIEIITDGHTWQIK